MVNRSEEIIDLKPVQPPIVKNKVLNFLLMYAIVWPIKILIAVVMGIGMLVIGFIGAVSATVIGLAVVAAGYALFIMFMSAVFITIFWILGVH